MSKILFPIPPSSFELIRDRVGEIISTEILKQKALTKERTKEYFSTVWLERYVPFGYEELPCINIRLQDGQFSNHDAQMHDTKVSINIDVYTSARGTSNDDGDKLSLFMLHKILGLCKGIIHNPNYITLGFQPPFIKSRRVVSMRISDEEDNQDAENAQMGRLTLEVDTFDCYENINAQNMVGYDTVVKLDETEKGFYFKLNN